MKIIIPIYSSILLHRILALALLNVSTWLTAIPSLPLFVLPLPLLVTDSVYWVMIPLVAAGSLQLTSINDCWADTRLALTERGGEGATENKIQAHYSYVVFHKASQRITHVDLYPPNLNFAMYYHSMKVNSLKLAMNAGLANTIHNSIVTFW